MSISANTVDRIVYRSIYIIVTDTDTDTDTENNLFRHNDILHLNYYVQHIGNKKISILNFPPNYTLLPIHIKTYGCRYHMTT